MFVVFILLLRKHAAHIHLNAALGSVDGAGMFANSFFNLFLPLSEEWVYQGLYFASAVKAY